MNKLTLTLALLAIGSYSYAGDLKAPFAFPSAKVLPKGVRNLSYKGVFASASEKYNGVGTITTLGNPLNSDISFQKVIDTKDSAWEKAAVLNIMNSLDKNLDDSFGYSTGDVKVAATAHVPVFAWGITKKLTLAMAVPVLESSMKIDTGVVQKNEELHQQMINALNSSGASSKVLEFNSKLYAPISEKLNEYGYKAAANEQKDVLGDIKLVAKYNILDQEKLRLTSQADVTLPTGEDADVNEVVDVASGDEQTDLGLGLSVDYLLTPEITLSSTASYTWQLADVNPERIPEVSYSKATPDLDMNTSRDLGNMANFQVAGMWSYKGFNLGAGYSYQSKEKDTYTGSLYSEQRYDWLEKDTDQEMQSLQLTAGLDTIYLFKKKAFPAPLKVMVSYTNVLSGKNVVKDPLYALDFNLFF